MLGAYEDAAEQATACYDAYYGVVAAPARTAMETKDYQAVIDALDGFAMTALPKAYADLPDLYNEACYQRAEEVYRAGEPYQAMPYYQRVSGYKDTADKLERRAYLVLGVWESTTGKRAIFRTDGTCELMGETFFFRVNNFSLYTGASRDAMTVTHKLSSISKTGMSLRDVRDGNDIVYKLTRLGDAEELQASQTPAPAQTPVPVKVESGDDMLVTEE
ncbi:MAG: hypothetical protein RSH26_05770 [Clostridia bacterium]